MQHFEANALHWGQSFYQVAFIFLYFYDYHISQLFFLSESCEQNSAVIFEEFRSHLLFLVQNSALTFEEFRSHLLVWIRILLSFLKNSEVIYFFNQNSALIFEEFSNHLIFFRIRKVQLYFTSTRKKTLFTKRNLTVKAGKLSSLQMI